MIYGMVYGMVYGMLYDMVYDMENEQNEKTATFVRLISNIFRFDSSIII